MILILGVVHIYHHRQVVLILVLCSQLFSLIVQSQNSVVHKYLSFYDSKDICNDFRATNTFFQALVPINFYTLNRFTFFLSF